MNAKADQRFILMKARDNYKRAAEIAMDRVIASGNDPKKAKFKEAAQKEYFDNKEGVEITQYLIECLDKCGV